MRIVHDGRDGRALRRAARDDLGRDRSVSTFDWHSIAPATLRRMPAGDLTVMVVTVVGMLGTHNLAVGVVLGVLTAMVIFARRVAHHVGDASSVAALDAITTKYAARQKTVEIVGLNEASARMHGNLAGQLR